MADISPPETLYILKSDLEFLKQKQHVQSPANRIALDEEHVSLMTETVYKVIPRPLEWEKMVSYRIVENLSQIAKDQDATICRYERITLALLESLKTNIPTLHELSEDKLKEYLLAMGDILQSMTGNQECAACDGSGYIVDGNPMWADPEDGACTMCPEGVKFKRLGEKKRER